MDNSKTDFSIMWMSCGRHLTNGKVRLLSFSQSRLIAKSISALFICFLILLWVKKLIDNKEIEKSRKNCKINQKSASKFTWFFNLLIKFCLFIFIESIMKNFHAKKIDSKVIKTQNFNKNLKNKVNIKVDFLLILHFFRFFFIALKVSISIDFKTNQQTKRSFLTKKSSWFKRSWWHPKSRPIVSSFLMWQESVIATLSNSKKKNRIFRYWAVHTEF